MLSASLNNWGFIYSRSEQHYENLFYIDRKRDYLTWRLTRELTVYNSTFFSVFLFSHIYFFKNFNEPVNKVFVVVVVPLVVLGDVEGLEQARFDQMDVSLLYILTETSFQKHFLSRFTLEISNPRLSLPRAQNCWFPSDHGWALGQWKHDAEKLYQFCLKSLKPALYIWPHRRGAYFKKDAV